MAKAPTVITAGTTVSGRIEGAEDVDVFGTVRGSIRLDGDLYVDSKARLEADLDVNNVVIHGIVVGNVAASGAVEISKSARIIGDITAPRVSLEEGALYRGTIDMGDVEGESGGKSRSSSRGRPSSRRSERSEKPAPAEKPAARPAPQKAAPQKKAPEPEPADDDDEPELPDAATKKKVAVKKRG